MKKSNFFPLLLFFALIAVFSIVACQKNDEQVQVSESPNQILVYGEMVSIKDGAIQFKDDVSCMKVMKLLHTHSNTDINKQLNTLSGFSSLADAVERAHQGLENAQSVAEYDRVLQDNSDILKTVNGLPIEKNYFSSMASVLTREGIFYIGSTLYHWSDKGELIVANGNMEKFKNILQNYPTESKGDVTVFPIEDGGSRSCGVGPFQKDVQKENFKSFIEVSRKRIVFQSQFDINLFSMNCFSTISGTPFKRNWLDRFVRFKTSNTLSSDFHMITFNGNPTPLVPNFVHSYSNNWDKIDDGTQHQSITNVTSAQINSSDILFDKITFVTHTHNGITNTLTCQ